MHQQRSTALETVMFDPQQYIRKHVLDMPPYEPILPFEVLSDQLGRPPERIIKMDANENPYGMLPAIKNALASLPFAHIYPDPESRQLRPALASYHHLPVSNILVGAGADELIDLIMRLIISPGDALINCPPTFGMYAFDADLNGARVVDIPRNADFSLNITGIEQAVEVAHPKILFLAHPNNPDGSLTSSRDLLRLLELPLILVLDEAYVEFALQGSSMIQHVLKHDNLIVLRTFSKWAGLAGLRVGYGVFPDWIMGHLWKIKQPYNVSVAASTAAITALQHIPDLEKIAQALKTERQRLFEQLQKVPWLRPYPSQANFILCHVLDRDASHLKANLAEQGILVRYFRKPDLDDHIRISVGLPAHNDAVVSALKVME